MSWAKRRVNDRTLGPEPKTAAEVLARGDVVYVVHEKKAARRELGQIPEAESALVALDPNNGAIMSLVGGFDYFEGQGKYNRATQAKRQPGSGFKPFMYAAALAGDFTPASVILDAPIIMDDPRARGSLAPGEFRAAASAGPRGCAKRWCSRAIWCRSGCCSRWASARSSTTCRTSVSRRSGPLPNNLTLALGSMQVDAAGRRHRFRSVRKRRLQDRALLYRSHREGPAARSSTLAEPKTVCAECAAAASSTVSEAERAKQTE